MTKQQRPHCINDAIFEKANKATLIDYIICFGRVRKDAVAQAWRRVIRKEQSMLIALAAARTGKNHLIVELVMPFVAGRRLGDAPFYAY